MRTRTVTALAAGLALLAAAGCSSADAKESGGSSSPSSSGSPAAQASAADVAALGSAENAAYLDGLYRQAVDAGQKSVTVYGVTKTSSASLYEAFHARYPEISVEHVSIFGPELQARIAGEQATGQNVVDQVSVSGADAVYLDQNKYLTDQDVPLADALPDEYKPAGTQLIGGNEYLYTVAYNSDLVQDADAPTSFDDLLDPRWAGKVGISDPTLGATGFVTAAIDAGTIDESWLDDFAATKPVIFPSERDLFTAISTGQIAVGVGNYIRGQAFLDTDDLPVKFVAKFDDGISTAVFYRGTVKDAPNPIASQLLVNWWLTPEAQTLIAAQCQPGLVEGAPPVPGQPGLDELTINPPVTFDEYEKFTTWGNDLFERAFS